MEYQKSHQVFLSDNQLADRFGVSRQTIWRWVQKFNFPQPVKLSPGCTRWILSDVELWEKAQTAA